MSYLMLYKTRFERERREFEENLPILQNDAKNLLKFVEEYNNLITESFRFRDELHKKLSDQPDPDTFIRRMILSGEIEPFPNFKNYHKVITRLYYSLYNSKSVDMFTRIFPDHLINGSGSDILFKIDNLIMYETFIPSDFEWNVLKITIERYSQSSISHYHSY